MKALLCVLLCILRCQGRIVFDLNDYNPLNKSTAVLKKFSDLTLGVTEIEINNVPNSVGFYIIQIHSFKNNITLSTTSELETQTFINGTNLGLVSTSANNTVFYVFNQANTTVLITVVIYEADVPIPGGCNLTFETEIAPYQIISYTGDLIVVQSQAPSPSVIGNGATCENNTIQVDLYHLYLHENNYEPDEYFEGLQKMLTVDSIKANGYKVNSVDGYFKYRKLYSAYSGIGHVFAIVASADNRSSAYVPAVSYGCDLGDHPEETCRGPVTPHWKLICAMLLIFGLFTCFVGHKFFRTSVYLIGFVIGVFITYVILSFSAILTVQEKTTTSLIIGLIYGSVWLFIWWKFGIPILSVSLTFTSAAFLISSIIFYSGVADLPIFNNDVNFWLTNFAVMIAFFIIWNMFTLDGHIFVWSFLGSYACVTALNYYTGGNLQYIIINAYRRIVIEHFNMATIDPPFQVLDGCQTLLWGVLTVFGCYYQWREQKGKPPFPPARNVTVEDGFSVSETSPLLQGQNTTYVM